MSKENVEVLRRIVEATGRGDYQAVVADLDPEVEIDDTDIPESTGTDSFIEWLARWDQVWESWRIEELDVRPAGEDHAVALFRMVAKGKGSGIELDRRDALVASLRDGKVSRLGYYNDQAQALEAAGLEESAGSRDSISLLLCARRSRGRGQPSRHQLGSRSAQAQLGLA